MFGINRYSLVVRAFFPASLREDADKFPEGTLLEGSMPCIVQGRNLDDATQQALNIAIQAQGAPFMAYHIPGKHSRSKLAELARRSPDDRVTVWEDKSRMTLFDLIVDYTVSGATPAVESKNDWLKLKAYTIGDAILVARSMITKKGGTPCAIQHVLGDHTLDELADISEGKVACVTRIVWFDEDAAFACLTAEEFLSGLVEGMGDFTAAQNLAHSLIHETRGPNAPGVLVPPARIDREAI